MLQRQQMKRYMNCLCLLTSLNYYHKLYQSWQSLALERNSQCQWSDARCTLEFDDGRIKGFVHWDMLAGKIAEVSTRIVAYMRSFSGDCSPSVLESALQTDTKKISAISMFFEKTPYRLDESTGDIDFGQAKTDSAGASGYSRFYGYARIRQLCGKQKAILLADAHISYLAAAGAIITTPFEYADVKGSQQTSKEVVYEYEDKINQAVFPGLQGGPHNHTITGLAVALKQATTTEYKAYEEQVLKNCSQFAKTLNALGYDIVSAGTEYLGQSEKQVMELVHIAANKNTVSEDVSAMVPCGIRMGTPALTSRGFLEEDFAKVAEFFDAKKDFMAAVENSASIQSENKQLRHDVKEYAKRFPTIRFCKTTMKYKQ
ncbi:hypothetical protein MKW98_029832 [Papaver atlanticum]|uniref:Serine hydroxymethyltransferase-like domain-containing protein n=1 Tax=Papaver atlanticum TaxID=357466 RepID=A0AAD4XVP0_9MAGN|nr:hypothetical protein MKW98_029832 [Papaver atlanticum]